MTNIKLRLSIATQKEEEDIFVISKRLPQSNLEKIYIKGEKAGSHNFYKESCINYVYSFNSITSIQEVNDFFIQQWNEHQVFLKNLLENFYEAYLLYEFDMDNSDVFPEMIYKKDFIAFIALIGIELQLYYYPK